MELATAHCATGSKGQQRLVSSRCAGQGLAAQVQGKRLVDDQRLGSNICQQGDRCAGIGCRNGFLQGIVVGGANGCLMAARATAIVIRGSGNGRNQ